MLKAVARWAPLVAAVGVACWLVWPACTSTPIAGVDVYMHVRRVAFGMETLLSRGSLDPWYPGAFVGFPLYAARGPGLTIASTIVALLGMGRPSPVVALNVVVLGSLVLVPLVVAYAAGGFGLDRRGACVAGLLSLLVSYPFVEGPMGLFGIGLLENQLGAVFAWIAIGALRRLVVEPRAGTQLLAIASTSALVITHTASTVAVVPIATLTVLGARPRHLLRVVPGIITAGVCAALLAGFWLVPFLAHHALVNIVIAGHGIAPIGTELREILGGVLYVAPAVWFVGGAWLLVLATWRRWPLGVLVAIMVPVFYFAVTRFLYHLAPRELTEQLARRGMGYAAILATFPLAAVVAAAMRRAGAVGATLGTAILTATIVLLVAPMRRIVGPHVPAPAPLPALATELEALVPIQGRFSTAQGEWYQGTRALSFPAPDGWLAWASHRNVLGGHTPASASIPWTITVAERYATEEPKVLADRLQRLGVTHVVMPNPELAASLAASSRFEEAARVAPAVVFSVATVPGFPGPATQVTTSVPADVEVLHYDAEHRTFKVRMSAEGVVTPALPWWPRWTATADGQPVELARNKDGLATIALPKGEHLIRLDYGPDGWDWLGRASTVVGIAAFVGILWRRSRHSM